MQLAFYARAGHVVAWPGSAAPGQPRRFVGRSFVASPDKKAGVVGAYVADKEPAKVDSDHPDAAHLVRQCQKGGLWAADADTARACGVELPRLDQDADGEWVSAKGTKSAKAPGKDG
jgi:hypothetical protein